MTHSLASSWFAAKTLVLVSTRNRVSAKKTAPFDIRIRFTDRTRQRFVDDLHLQTFNRLNLWYRSMHHRWHIDNFADRLCARGKRGSWNWRVYADASEPMRLCTILSGCVSPGPRGLCRAVTVGGWCISCCPFTPPLDQEAPEPCWSNRTHPRHSMCFMIESSASTVCHHVRHVVPRRFIPEGKMFSRTAA